MQPLDAVVAGAWSGSYGTALTIALLASCWLIPTVLHVLGLVAVALRIRNESPRVLPRKHGELVCVVRPINGLEHDVERCLQSSFLLDDPHFELIFCAHSETDPAVPIVRALLAMYPGVASRLLLGNTQISGNPKLNNIEKSWSAIRGNWVMFSDGNVVLPPDYLARHMAAWTPATGAVSTIQIGIEPEGFWAELECAILNQYHARWHFFASLFGSCYCSGKSMLIRRDLLDSAGGIKVLARETAEDVALTKLVWSHKSLVTPVFQPVAQPLGRRTASTVFHRQTRWARLRRLGYPTEFSLEIFSSALLPIVCAGALSHLLTGTVIWAITAQALLWYGSELIFARAVGFHTSAWTLPASVFRDTLIPVIWLYGWFGRRFKWGNKPVYDG